MSVPRLAIVSTHPIQYNAPVFQMLAKRGVIALKVFYTWSQVKAGHLFDPGFNRTIEWDIPLLSGYDYEFVENISKDPGSHHYNGIDNPGLVTTLEQYRPDAIMVISWKCKSHFKVLRYFHGRVPLYFRGDSTLLDAQSNLKSWLRSLVLTYVYRFVDKALYVGKNNKAYFLKHGVPPGKLFFVPHAIDNARFGDRAASAEREALDWRDKLGIPGDATVFLFAGKLEEKKNPGLLLECFSSSSLRGCHLVLVGNGVLEGKLKTEYGNLPGVHFIDFQNQSMMPVVYRVGDVFVLPSKGPEETWGLAINEAMACGCAVLVSDKCGGAVDLVKEGVNGFIFQSGDAQDLLTKMQRFAADKDLAKRMGEHSLALIQNFSFTKVCEQIESAVVEKKQHGVIIQNKIPQ